ncbi:conserved hypothetical protein [Ricinus communis]|uniref:Uncharacterized protein n=1 Tax=Ricinus communis TaxID=3988 RepID=B9TBD7_RICCO|nr:conserved hypothetical protein [Ricinus communis]
MTSCSSAGLVWRVLRMDGRATFTMKKSSGGRNAPTSNTANADHRRVDEVVICISLGGCGPRQAGRPKRSVPVMGCQFWSGVA